MSRRKAAVVAGILAIVALVGGGFAWVVLLGPGGATPTTALGAPRFVEETATAGIDLTYSGNARFALGGGVAVFDCSGDGKPDA